MPTFTITQRFARDLKSLTPEQRDRFEKVVREEFVPDLDTGQFRPGLRVKRVQGVPKVFEMTWAPNGRATWEYGASIRKGVRHVVWRRVGTHEVFNDA